MFSTCACTRSRASVPDPSGLVCIILTWWWGAWLIEARRSGQYVRAAEPQAVGRLRLASRRVPRQPPLCCKEFRWPRPMLRPYKNTSEVPTGP